MNTPRWARLALGIPLVSVGVLAPTMAGALPIVGTDLPPLTPVVVDPPKPPRTSVTIRPHADEPPKYLVQADWMFCNSETGLYNWTGSDEPRFDFVGLDEAGHQTVTSKQFGDVDSGESRFFGPMDVSVPMSGPFSLSVTLREIDSGTPNELLGHKDVFFAAWEFASATPTVGSTYTDSVRFEGDDGVYTLYLRTTRVS
jgi:hypothetical protein